jgi:hypothetical protein
MNVQKEPSLLGRDGVVGGRGSLLLAHASPSLLHNQSAPCTTRPKAPRLNPAQRTIPYRRAVFPASDWPHHQVASEIILHLNTGGHERGRLTPCLESETWRRMDGISASRAGEDVSRLFKALPPPVPGTLVIEMVTTVRQRIVARHYSPVVWALPRVPERLNGELGRTQVILLVMPSRLTYWRGRGPEEAGRCKLNRLQRLLLAPLGVPVRLRQLQ